MNNSYTIWDAGNGYEFETLGNAIAFMIHCLKTGAPCVTLEKDKD